MHDFKCSCYVWTRIRKAKHQDADAVGVGAVWVSILAKSMADATLVHRIAETWQPGFDQQREWLLRREDERCKLAQRERFDYFLMSQWYEKQNEKKESKEAFKASS